MDNRFSMGPEFGVGLPYREIPIASVIIIEGTYPRLEVDAKRVNMFKELFISKSQKIPPIRVIPLEDLDGQYVLIDGRHRLLGKQCHSDSIYAVLSFKPALTSQNIDAIENKRQIRLMASLCNSKHGLLFSRRDIRNNIIELYSMGTSPKDLYQLAPERTVRHYLKDIRTHERKKREEIKTVVLKMRAEGCTQKNAAAQLGITQGTVSKIESRARIGSLEKKNAEKTFYPANLPDGIYGHLCCTHDNSPDKSNTYSSGAIGAVEKAYELIRKVKVSSRSQQYVKYYLIPLLAEKFPLVDELIKGAGYAAENELLLSEKQSLIKHIAHIEKKHSEFAKSAEALRAELNARKNYCKRQCQFSREQYMKEQKYFLDSLIEDMQNQTQYIRIFAAIDEDFVNKLNEISLTALLEALNNAVRQKKSMPDNLETDLESLLRAAQRQELLGKRGKSGREAGKGELILQVMEINKNIMMATASNTAYKFLSTFDYCLQLRHTQEDLRKRLTMFTSIIRESSFSTDDLEERVREYNNILESYMAEDVHERVN